MAFSNLVRQRWLPAILASACLAAWASAQDYRPPTRPAQPPHRVAERSPSPQPRAPIGAARPGEHPLMPAVRWAAGGLENIQKIQDYSSVMVKRERIDGVLADEQYMFIKVRHRPFSVYIYFLKPESLRGQEALWIEGQNDGKMLAHGTGLKSVFGTIPLDPTGPIAMEGNRYPITEIGILNLTRRLKEVAQKDAQYGECEVQYLNGVKINGRSCTRIQVMHPVPRSNFLFHLALIYVDDELNVPIRYEAYDWPTKPGETPELIEQYTYLELKLNNGFTSADFDIRNPQYGFQSFGAKRR